jgi:two-component system, LytTR family, response regulator LytT
MTIQARIWIKMEDERIQIGIIEEELLIADDLRSILQGLGYDVIFVVRSAKEAKTALTKQHPALLFVNARLMGIDGIFLGRNANDRFKMRFIFIVGHADTETLRGLKTVKPNGYLIRPFTIPDVFRAIEMVRDNLGTPPIPAHVPTVFDDSLFVRDRNVLLKVKLDDILYIEADGNHSFLHTANRKFLISKTLKEISEKLPAGKFIRIHKSYMVGGACVTAIGTNTVYVDKTQLPVGRAYQQTLNCLIRQIG